MEWRFKISLQFCGGQFRQPTDSNCEALLSTILQRLSVTLLTLEISSWEAFLFFHFPSLYSHFAASTNVSFLELTRFISVCMPNKIHACHKVMSVVWPINSKQSMSMCISGKKCELALVFCAIGYLL